jgi:hypothetical protein
MRVRNETKTIKTVCGKTITYMQEEGKTAKMHSTTGPALVYSEGENKTSEYYLYGIKYTKQRWKELLTQHKATPAPEMPGFDL